MRANSGKIVIGLMVGGIFLFGCVKAPLNVKTIAKSEHPTVLLEKLGQDLIEAKKDRVELLSPNWFEDASASYKKAKVGFEKGSEYSIILEHIATGRAQLARAREFTKIAKKHIADVIESRDAAYAAGSEVYRKEFVKLESDFVKLTVAIENNNMGYVRNKKETVNEKYRVLELQAIKDAELANTRRLIRNAEDLHMDEAAPKSYSIAKSKLAEADRVISKDRYDHENIKSAVGSAEFYSRRLHQVAPATKKVAKMLPEDIVLWMESFLAQTNTHLKERDRRNLSFKSQQEVIIDAITKLQRKKSSVSSRVEAKELEINELKQRIQDLEGASPKVSADEALPVAGKRVDALSNTVKGYFSSNQAEVYKRSQDLVIRLKNMPFPVGQAVIAPSNYPLLDTVQKAIKDFGQPEVCIEAHTDGAGSEAINKKLSQSRAESVQQYLIQNGALPSGKVKAKGFGSTRPLASNATAKGRSTNRRIDVVIKPEAQ